MVKKATLDSFPGKDPTPEERLETLSEKWLYFKGLFDEAVTAGHEMRKTNLRGNLILIERAIRQLGGKVPQGTMPSAH